MFFKKEETNLINVRTWVIDYWEFVDAVAAGIEFDSGEWECAGWIRLDDGEEEVACYYEEGLDAPWYGTYYRPLSSEHAEWIEDNAEVVAACGFVLIYRHGRFWGMGVNGGGYSFVQEHFMPLYQLRGEEWFTTAAMPAA